MKTYPLFRFIATMLFIQVLFSFRISGLPALRLTDLSYGTDGFQKMDVYLVPGRTMQTPLIVLIHGGGWVSGDKKDANVFSADYTAQGFNVININYRLANSNSIHYQEIMQDVDAAFQFILKNAADWKVRNNKIILWGGSAGGHLAMLYAYTYDSLHIISSVITLGGPTKLDDRHSVSLSAKAATTDLLPLITGKPWTSGPLDTAYQLASPYYGKYLKPSFLAHGGADSLVSWLQARLMTDQLESHHIPNQLFLIPGGGHGGEGASQAVTDSLHTLISGWIKYYSL